MANRKGMSKLSIAGIALLIIGLYMFFNLPDYKILGVEFIVIGGIALIGMGKL